METSDNGEFEIEHVHRNGAAERNGNVHQGDMIDSINGRPVNGLKLSELGVRLPKQHFIFCFFDQTYCEVSL